MKNYFKRGKAIMHTMNAATDLGYTVCMVDDKFDEQQGLELWGLRDIVTGNTWIVNNDEYEQIEAAQLLRIDLCIVLTKEQVNELNKR